jgi:Sugar-binding N-terminal domain
LRNIVVERLIIVADDLAAAAGDHAIFKKVDSTLRGNLAVELRAVMAGRDGSCVVAAPASRPSVAPPGAGANSSTALRSSSPSSRHRWTPRS